MEFVGGPLADLLSLAFIAALVAAGVVAWHVRETNRTLMWALIGLVVVVLAGSFLWAYLLPAP